MKNLKKIKSDNPLKKPGNSIKKRPLSRKKTRNFRLFNINDKNNKKRYLCFFQESAVSTSCTICMLLFKHYAHKRRKLKLRTSNGEKK
jgi:hypothetical protein